MNDLELQKKMNELGVLMHGLEVEQAEFDYKRRTVRETIGNLKDEIREEILKRGASYHTPCLEVRWSKGKTTWNGSLLEGLALAHPEINAAKKVGKPTVSFLLPDEGWEDDGR